MKKGIFVALLGACLVSASSWAVMPLSEKQMKTVCLAFADSKRSLEGQMCGHYVLGFLDGDIVGGDPRKICVPDGVTLAEVMTHIVEQIKDVEVSETAPARNQVIPLLANRWPCAKPKPTPAPAPAPAPQPAEKAEPVDEPETEDSEQPEASGEDEATGGD